MNKEYGYIEVPEDYWVCSHNNIEWVYTNEKSS